MPVIDGVLGVRASVWYRYDGGWIDRVDPSTGATINNNINYSNSVMARLAARLQAQQQPHRDAEHAVPAPGQARRVDLLAGILRPLKRALQYRDP